MVFSPNAPAAPFPSLPEMQGKIAEAQDPRQRCALIADGLRRLWPGADLYACQLADDSNQALCILDKNGAQRPEWVAAIEQSLPGRGAGALSGPAEINIEGRRFLVEPLTVVSPARKFIGLGIDAGADEATTQFVRSVLQFSAHFFARHHGPRSVPESKMAQNEPEWMDRETAEAGLKAAPLVHEVNNYLNIVTLQLAVMAKSMQTAVVDELAMIRDQGKKLTSLIREWQEGGTRHRRQETPIELNSLVRAVLEDLTKDAELAGQMSIGRGSGSEFANDQQGTARIETKLADAPLLMNGTVRDVYFTIRLLVRDALAALPRGAGTVEVATNKDGGQLSLSVQDSGPEIAPEKIHHAFDASVPLRAGSSRLSLAAAASLIRRRLQGTIDAENRPQGGVVMLVRFRGIE